MRNLAFGFLAVAVIFGLMTGTVMTLAPSPGRAALVVPLPSELTGATVTQIGSSCDVAVTAAWDAAEGAARVQWVLASSAGGLDVVSFDTANDTGGRLRVTLAPGMVRMIGHVRSGRALTPLRANMLDIRNNKILSRYPLTGGPILC